MATPPAERGGSGKPRSRRFGTARPSGVRLDVSAADYAWALARIREGVLRPAVPAAYETGPLAPVLLVPGVLEHWTMMREIADRLNRVGHPIRTLPELRRNTIPIPAAAGLIARFLRERDLRGVVVVAHSKGGLIAKSLLLGEESDCIARVIAIATPFAGSSLATWMPSRTLRALRPADPTIAALVAELAVNARIVSVYPAFDPHIPGGSRLEGARNVPVSATGHFRVLGSPEVIDAVERHASPTVEG